MVDRPGIHRLDDVLGHAGNGVDMTDKHWTDAKIPNWVTESINEDLQSYQITAALSWPTETNPEPAPFMWGEYDCLYGEPSPGVYWSVQSDRIQETQIREAQTGTWKKWEFKTSHDWTTSVPRGKLYHSERDAFLAALWIACADAAQNLAKLRALIAEAET